MILLLTEFRKIWGYVIGNFTNAKGKGFFHLLSASIFVKIVAFGSQFFVAWWLTVEQIGEIKIIQSFFSLATVFVLFGFNTSVLKLCSEPRTISEIFGLYLRGKFYVRIVFFIAAPILFILAYEGILSSNPNINTYFLIVLLALYPAAMNEIDTVFLQATKRIKLLALRKIVVKTLSLLCIIVFTYFFGFNGYVFGYILSFVLSFIVFAYLIRKLLTNVELVTVVAPFSSHWKYSKYAVIALVLGQLSANMDVYIMNYLFVEKEQIGYYSFALLLVLMPTIFSDVIRQMVIPYFSNMSNNIIEIKRLYKKYQRLNVFVSLIVVLITIAFVPAAVKFIYGVKYDDSFYFFYVLIIAWFVNSLSQMKGLVLWGLGFIKYNVYISFFSTMMKSLSCILFIRYFGAIGLAYGVLFSNILSIFLFNIFFNRGLCKYKNITI